VAIESHNPKIKQRLDWIHIKAVGRSSTGQPTALSADRPFFSVHFFFAGRLFLILWFRIIFRTVGRAPAPGKIAIKYQDDAAYSRL